MIERQASNTAAPPGRRSVLSGGVPGNTRLTAMTGVVLLILLFLEGLTIPAIRLLFVPHTFIGFLLIPPLVLKLASTGYRFIRYYTGNARYREAGPPNPVLRMLAPLLVLSIAALIVTGIMLLLAGPADSPWRRLHTLAFLVWFGLMTIHVLAYAPRAIRLTWFDLIPNGASQRLGGAITRRGLIGASLLLGIVLAISLLPLNDLWVHALSVIHDQ